MQRTESIRACQLNPDKGSNTQKRRALDDPFLTTELVSSLLHVSHVPSISSFFAQFSAYADYDSVLEWMGQSIDIRRVLEGGCLTQCACAEAFDFRTTRYFFP